MFFLAISVNYSPVLYHGFNFFVAFMYSQRFATSPFLDDNARELIIVFLWWPCNKAQPVFPLWGGALQGSPKTLICEIESTFFSCLLHVFVLAGCGLTFRMFFCLQLLRLDSNTPTPHQHIHPHPSYTHTYTWLSLGRQIRETTADDRITNSNM